MRAKLVERLGPAPCVGASWFLPWSLYHFVGTPGGYRRPASPAHLTMAEHPGVFEEWARLTTWRQRHKAGVTHAASGLWRGGVLPRWAVTVSKAMDRHAVPAPHPVPPTPAPTPAPNAELVARAQHVVFTAWAPSMGLRGPKLAISADMGLSGDHLALAKAAVAEAKKEGKPVSAWANQSQVGIDHLYAFGAEIGAEYLIWQAETIGEMIDVGINMDGSIRPGSPLDKGPVVLIGNANAWTDAQRAKATELIHAGRLSFIQETYTDCGDPWPDAFGTGGVPCAAISPGVGWGPWPYQLTDYVPHTPASERATWSPYLAEGFHEESWGLVA